MDRLTEKDRYWKDEELWTVAQEPTVEEIDEIYNRLAELEDKIDNGQLVDIGTKCGSFIEGIEFDMAMMEYIEFVSAFVAIASFGAISKKKITDTMRDFSEVLRKRLFGETTIIDD